MVLTKHIFDVIISVKQNVNVNIFKGDIEISRFWGNILTNRLSAGRMITVTLFKEIV